jgi:ribosomal protein S27AE
MKYVSIGGATGENKFHLDGIDDKTFASFRDAILAQIQSRKQEIEKERTRSDVQAMLDFSILKDYMTKGGISVQSIKCPQCKAPLTMPENGSFVKCGYCGSTVYASDIMDRVKQLIG